MFKNQAYQWTVATGSAREVLPDERAGVIFKYTPCIGTKIFGGTVVFIVTEAGAVCGHFHPPPGFPDTDSLRTEDFMDRLAAYIKTWQDYFPPVAAVAWIFYDAGGPGSCAGRVKKNGDDAGQRKNCGK